MLTSTMSLRERPGISLSANIKKTNNLGKNIELNKKRITHYDGLLSFVNQVLFPLYLLVPLRNTLLIVERVTFPRQHITKTYVYFALCLTML